MRLCWLALHALLLMSGMAQAHAAGETRQVYWAGFAFTGNASTQADVVPYSTASIDAGGTGAINARLLEELAKNPPRHLGLIADRLAMLDGSTSATVLAAALDRELVSVEPIGDHYKVLVEVALQALFFDFRERQVIAAFPLTLQRIDLMDRAPDEEQIKAIVSGLLYGGAPTNLPRVFAQTLLEARLPEAAVRRLQVANVTVSESARQKLREPSAAAALGAGLAHELTKALAAATGVGLLPPTSGQAIGGVMAARFADGKVYQLKIPEADYVVQVQVDALKSGVVQETPAMRQMLFGAFFTVVVSEPYSGKVFFEQPLRKGATKVVPATQRQVDEWSASHETLLAGFDAFAAAAAGRNGHRAWLDEQKPGGRPLQQQTQALQELIKSCR